MGSICGPKAYTHTVWQTRLGDEVLCQGVEGGGSLEKPSSNVSSSSRSISRSSSKKWQGSFLVHLLLSKSVCLCLVAPARCPSWGLMDGKQILKATSKGDNNLLMALQGERKEKGTGQAPPDERGRHTSCLRWECRAPPSLGVMKPFRGQSLYDIEAVGTVSWSCLFCRTHISVVLLLSPQCLFIPK